MNDQIRDIQTIFNIAIESGNYSEKWDWMCGSLEQCRDEGLITQREQDLAMSAIEEYLNTSGLCFLKSALWNSGLSYGFKDRLAIYKDWANKPELES